LHGEALLIFGRLCDILVFEKLVGLFAGKYNENLKLLGSAMKVGYARVSTHDQHVALQRDALRKAGCRQLYEEVISGARADRPVLQQALAHLRQGDVLMIWKLDRLGRSLRHLIEVVSDLAQRGIGFKSLQENLDTTTSSGKLVFHRVYLDLRQLLTWEQHVANQELVGCGSTMSRVVASAVAASKNEAAYRR
jgi:Resolvase, N terminal domain